MFQGIAALDGMNCGLSARSNLSWIRVVCHRHKISQHSGLTPNCLPKRDQERERKVARALKHRIQTQA
jgi:hypothetical protein